MKRIGLVSLCLALAVSTAVWAVPTVALDPSSPGLYVTYDTAINQTDGWGRIYTTSDCTAVDGKAVPNSNSSYLAYTTTPTPGGPEAPITPMSKAQDWVMSFEWTKTSGTHSTVFQIVGGTAWGDFHDLVLFSGGGSDTLFRLYGGNGSNNFVQITSVNVVNGTYTLTTHYKAASGLFDFYLDDQLVAGDFVGADPGVGGVNNGGLYFQLRGGEGGTSRDQFDNVKVGLRGPDAPIPVGVQGSVVLQGHSGVGSLENVGVVLEFKQGGVMKKTARVFLDAAGNYQVPGTLLQGNYDLSVKSYAHLRTVEAVVVSANPTVLAPITLTAGDHDGDNAVTSSDLSIVLTYLESNGE